MHTKQAAREAGEIVLMSKNRDGHGRTVLGEKVTRLIFPMPLQLMHLRLNTIMCRTNPRPLQNAHMEKIVFVSKSTEYPPCHFSPLSETQGICHLVRQIEVMKGGDPTTENRVRGILTPEKSASDHEKITHRPDFFTWMRSTPFLVSNRAN